MYSVRLCWRLLKSSAKIGAETPPYFGKAEVRGLFAWWASICAVRSGLAQTCANPKTELDPGRMGRGVEPTPSYRPENHCMGLRRFAQDELITPFAAA
jgi:hypothetical protein